MLPQVCPERSRGPQDDPKSGHVSPTGPPELPKTSPEAPRGDKNLPRDPQNHKKCLPQSLQAPIFLQDMHLKPSKNALGGLSARVIAIAYSYSYSS